MFLDLGELLEGRFAIVICTTTWSQRFSGSGSSCPQKFLLPATVEGCSGLLLPQGPPAAGAAPISPHSPSRGLWVGVDATDTILLHGAPGAMTELCSARKQEDLSSPVDTQGSQESVAVCPSVSWIFGETDQLYLEPLTLSGAQALLLI